MLATARLIASFQAAFPAFSLLLVLRSAAS